MLEIIKTWLIEHEATGWLALAILCGIVIPVILLFKMVT